MPRDAITVRISGVHIYLLCPRHDPTRQRDATRLIDRSMIIIGIVMPLAEDVRYATALIEVAAMGSMKGVLARGLGEAGKGS